MTTTINTTTPPAAPTRTTRTTLKVRTAVKAGVANTDPPKIGSW